MFHVGQVAAEVLEVVAATVRTGELGTTHQQTATGHGRELCSGFPAASVGTTRSALPVMGGLA